MKMSTAISSVGDLLAALVRIPSVNPEGDPGTAAENCGEQRVAEFVGNYLQELGAAVRYEEVEPGRPNVIAAFPGGDGKPAVLLGPHLDTVGVGGMSIAPFGGERRDGRIYGRGACDTKGTMAAMLWALRGLGTERIAALDIGVTFVGFMGEETGQPGSRHFAKKPFCEKPPGRIRLRPNRRADQLRHRPQTQGHALAGNHSAGSSRARLDPGARR